jgi:hypothetical protein
MLQCNVYSTYVCAQKRMTRNINLDEHLFKNASVWDLSWAQEAQQLLFFGILNLAKDFDQEYFQQSQIGRSVQLAHIVFLSPFRYVMFAFLLNIEKI